MPKKKPPEPDPRPGEGVSTGADTYDGPKAPPEK